MGEQQNPGKKNKIPAPPGSQASPKTLKRKKNHYTKYPPACPPPPRGQQPKTPWHLNSPDLPKAVSQSPTERRFHWRKNIPRRKPANYRKKRSFLQFCAFAEKNAVSLAKPDCKGALAHKNPFLSKRPKPKPRIQLTLNSGKDAGSTGENAYQGGNRQTIQEFCFAEFLSFCAFAEKNAVSLTNQGCKGGKSVGRNDRLWHIKSHDFPKAVSQSPEFSLR